METKTNLGLPVQRIIVQGGVIPDDLLAVQIRDLQDLLRQNTLNLQRFFQERLDLVYSKACDDCTAARTKSGTTATPLQTLSTAFPETRFTIAPSALSTAASTPELANPPMFATQNGLQCSPPTAVRPPAPKGLPVQLLTHETFNTDMVELPGAITNSEISPGRDAGNGCAVQERNSFVMQKSESFKMDGLEHCKTAQLEGRNSIFSIETTTAPKGLEFCKTAQLEGRNSGRNSIETTIDLSNISGQPKGLQRKRHSLVRQMMFRDPAKMKDHVRQEIHKPEYNVQKFYKETGWSQAIVRSATFETISMCVVFVNCFWLAVDAEKNDADFLLDADPVFQIMEHLLCVFYTTEWLLKFDAFVAKRNAFRDKEFIFDTALVSMMVAETWVLTVFLAITKGADLVDLKNMTMIKIVRLMRIFRMVRVLRLVRALPELMVLCKGLVSAMRSSIFAVVLLMGVLYIFGVTFLTLTRGTSFGSLYFRTVIQSMSSLFLHATFPDQASFIGEASQDPLNCLLLLVYVFVACLTILNLLVGVIVNGVSVVTSVELEVMAVKDVRDQLLTALKNHLGIAGNILSLSDPAECGEFTKISRSTFRTIVTDNARAIHELGVDVVGLLESEEFIFADTTSSTGDNREDISFGEFMEAVLQLRATNQATIKHLMDTRRAIRHNLNRMQQEILKCIAEQHMIQAQKPRKKTKKKEQWYEDEA